MTNPTLDQADSGYWSIANYVGRGFRVYGAYSVESTTGNLFVYPPDEVHDFTFQGITVQIPNAMNNTEYPTSTVDLVQGSTREAYQNKLAVSVDVEVGFGAFSGAIKSSFSSSYENTTEHVFNKLTSHLMVCILELRRDVAILEPGFVKDIENLPDNINNLQPFSDFFEKYGTHHIWQITCGGSLEFCTVVNKSTLLTERDIDVSVHAQYASICKAGVKVDTSDKYQKFEANSTTTIKAMGGNQALVAALVGLPPEPSKETVGAFTLWANSIPQEAFPVSFKLRGIWELCGVKRNIVQEAWQEHGAQMHPKLTVISTRTPSTAPIITLNGRELKPTNKFIPSPFGGWQVIIFDRYDISDKGVKFNQTYSFSADGRGITQMYVLMNNDIVKSGFYDNSHLLMVVSYGIIRNWGPLGEFFRLLSVSGGTIGNMKQIRPWDQGSSNPDDVDYLLLGAFESGPNAGLDFFYGYYVDVFYGYYDHNLNFLEYNVAFYRDRLNGPYSFSLISAGPR